MIETHSVLEDYTNLGQQGPGTAGGMVGAMSPHHHHHHHIPSAPHHHQDHHHHHPHPHHHTGVYMKPVYNLSSLCQGPLSPPDDDKLSPGSSSHHLQHLGSPGGPLQHLPHSHQGSYPLPTTSPYNRCNSTANSSLTIPILPAAKKFRDHHHHHHHHSHHHQEMLRCKRRVDLSHKLGYKTHPTAVARRNERERNRVKHINSTFATLRQHIPCAAKNKKMSKVETLRSAIRYIHHLQQILETQKAAALEEEERDGVDAEGGDHQGLLQPPQLPTTATGHLFSPSSTSSLGSPGVILTSRLRDCDLTSPARGVARPTTASSSVLLSPPGSPSSCGRPGSASGSDLSPPARYYHHHHHHHHPHHRLRGGDDMDEEGMEDEDEEDGELGEEEDQHDLTQFADWF